VNWKDRWPDFHEAIIGFQREGKNKHDDAPDALTGLVEKGYGTQLEMAQISAGDLGL
jgi:predicted phage terminase large subunit-like protein